MSNGVNHPETGHLPPEVSFKPIGTVKIKRPQITELPSPDHDYSATRLLNPPKPALAPAPVTANNGNDLPGQLSSAVDPEDPAPAPAAGKKGREATRRTTRTAQSKRNDSSSLITQQLDSKEKGKGRGKGNNPKVKMSVLVPSC